MRSRQLSHSNLILPDLYSFGESDGSDESRPAAGAGVVAAGRRGEGRGVHLHDERFVLLLPLAGVLVVLEREQRNQLHCFSVEHIF